MSSEMDTVDHRKVEELFHQAADLPPEQRASFLDTACSDPVVREDVDSLLAHLGASRIASLQAVDLLDGADGDLVNERVGPYRLLELLGEGGFGAVYVAEQEHPVRRMVAVKILKLGMDTKQVVARFEAERQALAMMEHPSIARVFDAGVTETGRPYFAMELVRGAPIIEHCNEHRTTTRERLELFIQVCRGVQHAHQKGIIHRDLKPSNVLVTAQDGVAVPKIIDFGIAKAADQPLADKTSLTGFRQFVGTPQYVSPEQAGMGGADVDTRSDVYSLGVLLYELLTGMTPFDSQAFRRATYSEMQRIICEQNPVTPSRRISTLGAGLTEVAGARRTEPHVLRRLLRGDLDWIVMKALEKDRNRRYETAAAMADDVQRHLDHEPVSAGPPGVIYRVKKLAARHRAVFSFAAAMLLVVLGFGVWMSFLYAEADELRRRAELQRSVAETNLTRARQAEQKMRGANEIANQIAELVSELFEVSDPAKAEETLREVFAGRPRTLNSMDFVARVLMSRGQAAEAEAMLRRALAIAQAEPSLPCESCLIGVPTVLLGDCVAAQGRYDEAEALLLEGYSIIRKRHSETAESTVEAIGRIVQFYETRGKPDRAAEWRAKLPAKDGK